MKLSEIWTDFEKGKWVSRKQWKQDYAIALCNLDEAQGHPVLMHDTHGDMYHFGKIQTGKMMRRLSTKVIRYGLQYDLLADDWFVADQSKCDLVLMENDK